MLLSRVLRVCSLLFVAAAAWIAAPAQAHEGHVRAAAIERSQVPAQSLDGRAAVRSQAVPTIETVPSCPDPDGDCCGCRHACRGPAQPHAMAGAPLPRLHIEPTPRTDASFFYVTQFVPAPRASRAHGARAPPPPTQS